MAKLLGLPSFTMGCMIAACAACAGCAGCAGCASSVGGRVRAEATHRSEPVSSSPSSVPGLAAERDAVIIGKLELRNAKLVVFASGKVGDKIRFGVLDRAGNALGETLTEADLSTRFPEVHQAYRQAVAKGQPFPDARVDPKYLLTAVAGKDSRFATDPRRTH